MYDAWGNVSVQRDNSGCKLSRFNPFLYRSYIYDFETWLYYLQSRYYDPEIGRFISADEPVFIGVSKNLAFNAYAYCCDNPINMIDDWGTDAIWLQAKKSVGTLGHTGLLFQYKNVWYYWYWGGEGISDYLSIFIASLTNIKRKCRNFWWVAILLPLSFLSSLAFVMASVLIAAATALSSDVTASCILTVVSVSKELFEWDAKAVANQRYDSNTKFDATLYFEGDFEGAYGYFERLKNNGKYNLFNNNCMQTTVCGLLNGTFKSDDSKTKLFLIKAKNKIIPNLAYNYLKQNI